uniref:CCHC-type domain-containing protein n=1 Tax=Oncorhynchus tshawytscha TaxID=74940 RepID=A0AAZ3NXR0_ONCTS
MGTLKLKVKDVLCLQENPTERAFDVTFHREGKHEETLRKAKEESETKPMCYYKVTNLAKSNFRVVTVTMYNPHVTDEEVRAFLGRYMDNISSGRLLKDSLGFWTGKRGYQALLREDPSGFGGYLHPPAMFSLGADRGTLFYARQPPFCRRCMAYGHVLASCNTRRCRFCGSEEHEARDCVEPKKCHGCGSVAHLWRDCPARRRSYASAAGGGARAEDGGREEPEEGGGRTEQKESEGGEEKRRRELGQKERWWGRKERWLGRKERWPGRKERWPGRKERWSGRKERWSERKERWPERKERWPERKERRKGERV